MCNLFISHRLAKFCLYAARLSVNLGKHVQKALGVSQHKVQREQNGLFGHYALSARYKVFKNGVAFKAYGYYAFVVVYDCEWEGAVNVARVAFFNYGAV